MALLSLIGLALASRAEETVILVFGLVIFGFGILQIFRLIDTTVGQPRHHRSTDASGD